MPETDGVVRVSQEKLNAWAEVALRINHVNTLVQREIDGSRTQRAKVLSERARVAAWNVFNSMVECGAEKPADYREPDLGDAQ